MWIGSQWTCQVIVRGYGWDIVAWAFAILCSLTVCLLMALPAFRELGRRFFRWEAPPDPFASAIVLLGVALFAIAAGLIGYWNTPGGAELSRAVNERLAGGHSSGQRVAQLQPKLLDSLNAELARAGVRCPPTGLTLVVFKDTRIMEVLARCGERWKLASTIPILGASGGPGPKLREGDLQVPEGVYRIESLNPNSAHHLALRIGYPSAIDRAYAMADGRTALGGDIMIHGGSASIGCIAIGDPAIERLFVLAYRVGIANIEVIIAPCDLRHCNPPMDDRSPSWLSDHYAELREKLTALDYDAPTR